MNRTGRNGSGKVIYVDVALFLNQLMSGQFRTDVVFLVDESLTASAEYEMIRGFVLLLANLHVVVQVSTQNGDDSESLGAGVQVEAVSKLESVERTGKSILRFHASTEEAMAAASAQEKVLLPVDGYTEYADVFEHCKRGGVVHLPVSLAAGLNLPVDYVVSTAKQVALVVRHPELEFMKTRVDQLTAFQQAGRLCRSGKRAGVCFTEMDPRRIGKGRVELPSGERTVAAWFLSIALNLSADGEMHRYLDSKLGFEGLLDCFVSGESWRDRFRYGGGKELVLSDRKEARPVFDPQKIENILKSVAEVYCDPDGVSEELQLKGVLGRDGRYLARAHKNWHPYLVSRKGLKGLHVSEYLVDQEAYQDLLGVIIEHRNFLVAQVVTILATAVVEGKIGVTREQFTQQIEDIGRVVCFYGAVAALVPEWVPSITCKLGDTEVRLSGAYLVPTVKVVSTWRTAFTSGVGK
jgi:hypothetical protein